MKLLIAVDSASPAEELAGAVGARRLKVEEVLYRPESKGDSRL